MTETTIVQPGASPSIYTTGDHGRHHDDHRHRFDELRTDADYRSLISQGSVNGDRINSGVQVTGDRINAVGAAGALAAGHTDQLVQTATCHTDQLVLEGGSRTREVTQAGFGGVSREICESTKDVTAALGTGFTASALAACKTSDEVAAVYASLQKQTSDAATATVVGFKDAQATAYQIEGRNALDAAKNAAALGLQATTNASASSVEATKNFYALSVELVKNASAAELRAQQIAAAASKQAAECCCELKALIVSDGNTTRALINQNTIEALRAQLVATQRLIPVTIGVGT